MKSMCNCVQETIKQLKDKGLVRIELTYNMVNGCMIMPYTHEVARGKKQTCINSGYIQANYCPFCGKAYEACFVVNTPDGDRGVKLPANVPAILEVLKQQKRAGKIKTNPDYAQAERVAWRIIKDWIEAQMAILESQMVQFEEIFLPYMVNNKGLTFFQAYQQKQLSSGD